jgi:hypothetical protein
MNSAPATGYVAHVPVQAPGQPPIPVNPPLANPPEAPVVRNVPAVEDPRGVKRGLEREDVHRKEPSSKPVFKRSRTLPNAESEDKAKNALFDAIGKNDLKNLKNLLGRHPDRLEIPFYKTAGLTPLCYAAFLNNEEIMKYLFSKGVKVDTCARNGSTPLMFAADNDCTEAIELLAKKNADLNAVNMLLYENNQNHFPFTALDFAIRKMKVEACKKLINSGADLVKFIQFGDQDNQKTRTPLLLAIESDFEELFDWLIQFNDMSLNFVEPSTKLTLINAAASQGSLPMVYFFMRKGANPNGSWVDKNGRQRSGGVWTVACNWRKASLIEALLFQGDRPPSLARGMKSLVEEIGCNLSTDLILHEELLAGHANADQDGLTDISLRRQPNEILELIIQKGQLFKNAADCGPIGEYLSKGLSASFLSLVREKYTNEMQNVFGRICGRRFDTLSSSHRITSTYAQEMQILIEHLSEICGDPSLPRLFADQGLTSQGETLMTRMLMLQRDLMLQGIAHLRIQFDSQVARLPDLCMNTYISREHRLNEADLYRVLTEDCGLYDPIARAALNLVKEAYHRLRHAAPGRMPSQFVALSPTEQLKFIIIDVLEEWDKIPEIIAAFTDCRSTEQMDITVDLLFQQWRMFNEALGVTKERSLSIGPRTRNEISADQMTIADPS